MASDTDKLYRTAEGHAWVGEYFVGRFPENATHFAELPEADDQRWRKGAPTAPNIEFITLSKFSPSGRLGVCVEEKSSQERQYANYPAFEGCIAWMPVSEASWTPIERPEQSRYVVLNEHTLGYLIPEMPSYMGILAGSVLKGGYNPLDGTALLVPKHSKLRQATLADFAEYRVMPPSCFNEAQYNKE